MKTELLYDEWSNDIACIEIYIDEFLFEAPHSWKPDDICKRYYQRWAATEALSLCILNAPCPADLVILDFTYEVKEWLKNAGPNMTSICNVAIETAYDMLNFLQEG